MLACGTHFFFDNVVSIEPKDDMCRLQRPKVLSELAMCVNVPKIALMIHPGSTLNPHYTQHTITIAVRVESGVYTVNPIRGEKLRRFRR